VHNTGIREQAGRASRIPCDAGGCSLSLIQNSLSVVAREFGNREFGNSDVSVAVRACLGSSCAKVIRASLFTANLQAYSRAVSDRPRGFATTTIVFKPVTRFMAVSLGSFWL
jgi:hypothetical protein